MEPSRSASCRMRPVSSRRTSDRRISSSLPPRHLPRSHTLGGAGRGAPIEITGQGPPIAVGEPAMLTFVDSDAQWTVHGA